MSEMAAVMGEWARLDSCHGNPARPAPPRRRGGRIRRREFIGLLGGAAACPLAAWGQQPGKVPTIGLLGSASRRAWSHWTAAFVQRLHDLGWIEGRTVAIEYRWAEGRSERYAELAAEFVRLNVDVIVTTGAPAMAAKVATSNIPIVFALAPDPIGSGLVGNLARPGGNVTGLSRQSTDAAGKRLEILHEAVPGLRLLGILANSAYSAAVLEMGEVETAARRLGMEVTRLEVRGAADIAGIFERIKGRAEGLYVCPDPLLASTNRVLINSLALGARLPTMVGNRESVEAGGLMAYGPDLTDLFRRAADYVDKILRGARPPDIPVEQPTKFELVINLKTAEALGLEIPPTLLARADEVIE
jgi:putative ABC transport system substrate-binding protein